MSARRAWLALALGLLAWPALAQQTNGMMTPNVIRDYPMVVKLIRPTAGQQFVVGSTMEGRKKGSGSFIRRDIFGKPTQITRGATP